MHRMAQAHKLKTGNIQSEELFCLFDTSTALKECPEITDDDSKTSIIAILVKIRCTNNYTDIYLSYMYALHFIHSTYVYWRSRNDRNISTPLLGIFIFKANQDLFWKKIQQGMINRTAHTTILNIWNPLKSDIIGFTIDNIKIDGFPFSFIYLDQISHLEKTNQTIVAYIPQDYFQYVTNDLSQNYKNSFYVLMLFLYSQKAVKHNTVTIGISIPDHCDRNNNLSILRAYIEPAENWADIGTFSIPSARTLYPVCMLESISYLEYNILSNSYTKSYDKIKYCTPVSLYNGSLKINFDLVAANQCGFSTTLLIDNILSPVTTFCLENGTFEKFKIPKYFLNTSHLVTSQSLMLYENAVKCCYNPCLIFSFYLNANTTYLDILLYFVNADYYYYNFIPIEDAITLLEKGMQLLTIQAEPSVQFIHLPSLLYFFADAFLHKTSVVERSKLIILTIADVEDDLVGIVLYENNTFKTLTSENSTNKFVNIDDAEVLVQLSHNCTKSEIEKILPIAIFIINDDYYYKTMSLSNSKMIALYHYGLSSGNCYYRSSVNVYLKILDNVRNGYWHRIALKDIMLTLIHITDSKQNICSSPATWNIFNKEWYSIKKRYKRTSSFQTKTIDIFSRLSMILNPQANRKYYKNYETLKAIKFLTSILSITGIFCMLITGMLLNDWFKLRIYSNQLSISLLIQAIFFFLDTESLNHMAYVFFYYSILTQFVWMAFVGYVQYARFIRVFGNTRFSIQKSLMFGWGLPAVVTISSTILYKDCLKCKFCTKNDEIFKNFVIAPILLITACNFVVYCVVMVRLWKSDIGESYKKYRIRATIALPFMLGLVWIVMFTIMAPVPMISLCGWYLFYLIVPSQGFVLFIFMVLLDEDTRNKWLVLLRIKRKIM